MRLSILFVLMLLLLFSYSECQRKSWLPNIVNSISEKTSQFSRFIRQKGRNFGNNYVYNVRKLISDFGRKLNRKATKTSVPKCERGGKRSYREIGLKTQGAVDPSITYSTPQLIAFHGYPAESHTVVTADGYILTIHRIPKNRNGTIKSFRKTVLLHHGLLGSSADWVIAGPNQSLAYILSDAGYDVWLANVRGNTYSRAHLSEDTDSYAFWNFTFHEVSQYDVPAVIEYIMDIKGWDVKINYIGHSMGTTILFALLSTQPQYNKILRAGFALAPVAYMSDIKSPIRFLAKFSNDLAYLMKILGANEFLPQNEVMRWLSRKTCELNHYEKVFCENAIFVLCGYDPKEFNTSLLPFILSHVPAGASTKTLIHYAQEIKNEGRFQQYDYGATGNVLQYGSIYPPEYHLNEITLPIALFSASNDWLASEVDVTNLYAQLQNPIEHYKVPLKQFNHIDFLWADDAPRLVYKKLLQLLEEGVRRRSSTRSMTPVIIEDD